jgi:hypothetical protein
MNTTFWLGNANIRDHLGALRMDGRIILIWTIEEQGMPINNDRMILNNIIQNKVIIHIIF